MPTEIEDEFVKPSIRAVEKLARRYHELKNAAILLPDTGETMSLAMWKREMDRLADQLKGWLAENDEELFVEGVGNLRLQHRTTTSWDVQGIKSFRPDLFDALLSLDCLKVDGTKVKAHAERLTGLKALGFQGETVALVIE